MISRIQKFFQSSMSQTDEQLSDHRLNMAAAALLIEIGRADFSLQPEEIEAITQSLQKTLDISDAESATLVSMAMEESESASSLYEFTKLIKDHYTPEQKQTLMEQLWRVAFSDNQLNKYEEHLLRRIADLIYLPHKDFIQAKHRVEEEAC